VVLDLMIHDIDLIQELVGAPIESIDAIGSSVFSGEIDIVNARLRFKGGCVANTTASRISLKQERKIRIFQDDAYLSIDMQQKILSVIRKKDAHRDRRRWLARTRDGNADHGARTEVVPLGQMPPPWPSRGGRGRDVQSRLVKKFTAESAEIAEREDQAVYC
jgi:predicted dehydrogenase